MEKEFEIIKWVIFEKIDQKSALSICGVLNEDLDVFVYTKEKHIKPILLSEYLSV